MSGQHFRLGDRTGKRRAGPGTGARPDRPDWARRRRPARFEVAAARPLQGGRPPYWVKVPLAALPFEDIRPAPGFAGRPSFPGRRRRRWPAWAALAASLVLAGLALAVPGTIARRLPISAPAADVAGPAAPSARTEPAGSGLATAIALRDRGVAAGDAEPVEKALAMLEAEGTRAESPRLRAEIGLTQKYLADLKGDAARRSAAIASDKKALAGFLAAGDERNAAVVAYNLVTALGGGRDEDLEAISGAELKEAAARAPSGIDRSADPEGWARLEFDIGRLAFIKGSSANDPDLVQMAVKALKAGLEVADGRDAMLADQAEANNLLGNALEFMAPHGGGRARLAEALGALRRSLALYEKAGLGQYRFYLEGRIATLERKLAGTGAMAAADPAASAAPDTPEDQR